MTDCPRCGGDAEFANITGTAARPTGARYRCPDCKHQFTEIDPGRTGAPLE